MKHKLFIGLMLSVSPAFCQFGFPAIVWDPKTMAQMVQDVNQAVRLYALVQNTAAAFKSGDWQYAFQAVTMDAAAGLAATSPSMDPTRVAQLAKAIKLANRAAQESYLVGGRVTTGNAALLSMMAMQQIQAQIEHDQLANNLQFQSDVDSYAQQYGVGLGSISTSIKGWIPK
jgi:hypothetical protein